MFGEGALALGGGLAFKSHKSRCLMDFVEHQKGKFTTIYCGYRNKPFVDKGLFSDGPFSKHGIQSYYTVISRGKNESLGKSDQYHVALIEA